MTGYAKITAAFRAKDRLTLHLYWVISQHKSKGNPHFSIFINGVCVHVDIPTRMFPFSLALECRPRLSQQIVSYTRTVMTYPLASLFFYFFSDCGSSPSSPMAQVNHTLSLPLVDNQ